MGPPKKYDEKISEVLNQAGISTDLMPVEQVRDIAPYQAVILSVAVYIGKWPKEAVMFLKANEQILAGWLVWLFSSGPSGEGDPIQPGDLNFKVHITLCTYSLEIVKALQD